MKNRILIKEAVEKARNQGITISKSELANRVFKSKNSHSSIVRLNNYERGDSTKIDRIQIVALCRELDTTADQLFGVKPKTK